MNTSRSNTTGHSPVDSVSIGEGLELISGSLLHEEMIPKELPFGIIDLLNKHKRST